MGFNSGFKGLMLIHNNEQMRRKDMLNTRKMGTEMRSAFPTLMFMDSCNNINLIERTNKTQPCSRIYDSNVS